MITRTYKYPADGTKISAMNGDGEGKEYCGTFVYDRHPEEGCDWTELGSIRSVVLLGEDYTGTAALVEQNGYYPFGTRIAGTAGAAADSLDYVNRYRFCGKEEQDFSPSLNLKLLDFSARYYDPFTCRWTTQDPLAEKYPAISTYAYCANNPVNLVDPDGAWVWNAVGAGIEYGTQVYHNYQNGDSGYDAWFGNVNFVRVLLSAANPGKKFTLAKTVIIEGVKASISFTPKGGLSVNSDAKDVAKETTMNTVTSQVIGKLLNATSQEAVESTAKEASKVGKALNSAVHKASHKPNSTKAANALKKAEQTAVVSSKHAAGIKALNQTVGASPEATQYTIELFINMRVH